MASAQFWPSSSSPPPIPSSQTSHSNSQISSQNFSVTSSQHGFTKQTTIGAQISNQTLLQLQREIKEEEDEIFADIDSILNGRSLHPEFDEDDEDIHDESSSFNHDLNDHSHLKSKNVLNSRHSDHYLNISSSHEEAFNANTSDGNENTNLSSGNETNNFQFADENENPNQSEENDYTLLSDENSTQNLDANDRKIIRHPLSYEKEIVEDEDHDDNHNHEHHHSHEEEKDDEDENGITDPLIQSEYYEHLQAVIKQVTSTLPKPCVFFLEGNCRRSDCKFSHDLSSIPCKYWIEGFCFKGELCPFSHDFSNLVNTQDPTSGLLVDEDGRPLTPLSAAKREQQLNPTFVIDSEADFPSLPLDAPSVALNDNSTSDTTNQDAIANTIRNQILSSNASVVFKTVKRKRRKG